MSFNIGKVLLAHLSKEEVQKYLIKFALEQMNTSKVRRKAKRISLNIFHEFQVWSKQVNLHTQEEAIKIALEKCLRKDYESQMKVSAFVIGLYLQHGQDIKRAAQVGGSLLKRFGRTYFPHIKDRELKFALKVDSELENYLYQELFKEEQKMNS